MASSAPTYPAYNPAAVPTTMDEKIIAAPGPAPSAFTPYLDAIHSLHRPLTNPLVNTYSKFESWKSGFGLYQPGTVENLTREIKRTSYSPRAATDVNLTPDLDPPSTPSYQQKPTLPTSSSMEPEPILPKVSPSHPLSKSPIRLLWPVQPNLLVTTLEPFSPITMWVESLLLDY